MTHIDSPLGASPLTPNISPERIHRPGTPGHANCTRLWNGAVTRRPAIVVQPTSHAEVQSVVRYARDRGMPIAVRGGGHDWAGRSLLDDGVVIDMSLMRRVVVDQGASVATLAGGATAADVVAAAEPFGLAAATGTVGEVGMVGLTLAGGYGPLNGVAGLAIDNMVGAELVAGDGCDLTVNAHTEPDLFWALRGGGGNFGVVTAMHVKLHPVASVIAGVILFPWHQAADVMRGYDALVPAMPDELTVQIGVISGPDGQPVVYLSPVWSGNPAEGHLLPRHENFAPLSDKMSAPHATTTPNRCAPRAPDMSDRNGGRPASRVEPRIAVAIQSAWCFPTAADLASQADRRAGDRLLLARTLHGLRRMGATGIVDNAGSGSLWSTIAHERYYRHAYATTAERIAAVDNWMQFHKRETALSDWDAPDYRL